VPGVGGKSGDAFSRAAQKARASLKSSLERARYAAHLSQTLSSLSAAAAAPVTS